MARSNLKTALMNRPEAPLSRKPLAYQLTLPSFAILMGGEGFISLALPRTAQSTSATRADLFMQSVATRDGALGWHQFWSVLRARLSVKEPGNQTFERNNKGGEMRFYLVTAKRPDGWQTQRTYFAQTQPGSCVQDFLQDFQGMDISGRGAKE